MLIRPLVIASLIAGAATAQAGTITTPAASPSNVVSGWTTGNGTDVLGSGVLQGNMNLVAGIAHSADASLSDLLMGKVAGTVANVDGQTKLFFQRGIEANYLLASGHGILAATQGLGKSVVADADGAIISDGVNWAPGKTGGGSNNSVGSGGSGSTGVGAGKPGGGSASTGGGLGKPGGGVGGGFGGGSGSTGGGFGGGSGSTGGGSGNTGGGFGNIGGGSGGSAGIGAGGSAGNSGSAGIGAGGSTGNSGFDNIGSGNSGSNNNGSLVGDAAAPAAEVPEPSSIALMLLGMMGAGAFTRRRSR